MHSDKQKNEYTLLRLKASMIKLHSFCIFLSIIFYYVIVFSTPKMSYVKSSHPMNSFIG